MTYPTEVDVERVRCPRIRWCSAISEVAGRLGLRGIPINILAWLLRPQLQDPTSEEFVDIFSQSAEREFLNVGPEFDPVRSAATSHRTCGHPKEVLAPRNYRILLLIALEIGFRPTGPGGDQPALRLSHISTTSGC